MCALRERGSFARKTFRLIRAMTLCLMVASVWLRAAPVRAAATLVAPSDPNIAYIGRWDTSDSSDAISYWDAAYFKVNFTGTTVAIKLGAPVSFFATIDHLGDVGYTNVQGTIQLTATPLASGTHSLRITARSETDSLHFQGLVLDDGAVTQPPTLAASTIEFIGDSITAGYLNTNWGVSNYAWRTAQRLGDEIVNVSQPGICLVDGVACYAPVGNPKTIGQNTQFFKLQTVAYDNSPDWNFATYQPQTVVINLGTNDASRVSGATFQSTYGAFLAHIRAVYPAARIFVLRTFGGFFAAETAAVVQARNSVGDANVFYVDTTNWLSSNDGDFQPDGIHPTDRGQVLAADDLAQVIHSVQIVDDATTDGSITTTGQWHTSNQVSGYLNQTAHWSNDPQATLQFSFTGTSIRWIGGENAAHGKADVYLDNQLDASAVDTYAATNLPQVVLYAKSGLRDTAHTLTIKVRGDKDSPSTDTTIDVDAFQYTTGTTSPQQFDDAVTAGNITYTGSWQNSNQVQEYFQQTAHWSNIPGNSFQVSFTGTSIAWIGGENATHGKADVSIDNQLDTSAIDTYAASTTPQVVLYDKAGLSNTTHTMTITVRGDKDAASEDTTIDADAFVTSQ